MFLKGSLKWCRIGERWLKATNMVENRIMQTGEVVNKCPLYKCVFWRLCDKVWHISKWFCVEDLTKSMIWCDHCDNIVGKTRRHVCASFQACCAIICQWSRKYWFFTFCCENWHKRWMNKQPVRLSGGQTFFFLWNFTLSWGKFWMIASVLFLAWTFCLC